MKALLQITIALIILASAAAYTFAQTQNAKVVGQIMKLEAAYNEASKKFQAEDFDRFYAANFMMTARVPARIVTKAESLAWRTNPNFRRGKIESLTDDDVKVRVYGDDTAVVTGKWKRVSKNADGKDTSAEGRFTRVRVRQNGKWLLAAAHYSPLIDLEKLRSAQAESRKN